MRKIEAIFIIILLALSCSGTPQLAVEPTTYDLGKMMPKERANIWFTLRNPGEEILVIENVRSMCDCIIVETTPDSIPPGGVDSLMVSYIAPDSAGPDQSSLMLRTNTEPKNTKLTVTADVIKSNLEPGDSSVVIVPFQNRGMPGGNEYSLELFKYMAEHMPAGFTPLNPNEYTEAIQGDPHYTKLPIHDVARKWNNILGVRYGVFGEVRPNEGGGVDVNVMVVDGFFHLPLGRIIPNIPADKVNGTVSDTLNSILLNAREYVKQALMADLQQQWAKQRAELINKPAPEITATDVRTNKEISLSDFRGKPLVLQFFSTDCEHCEEEMDWLSNLVTNHPEIAALGISVNVGERDSVINYIKDKNLLYPVILPDEESESQLDPYYGGATPQTVIISPDGIVAQSMVGFSKNALANFEKILQAMLQPSEKAERTE